MHGFSVVTGTITYAIKGRDILRRYGYRAHIEKITDTSQNVGCGYTVVFKGDIVRAQEILRNAGVRILQIREI